MKSFTIPEIPAHCEDFQDHFRQELALAKSILGYRRPPVRHALDIASILVDKPTRSQRTPADIFTVGWHYSQLIRDLARYQPEIRRWQLVFSAILAEQLTPVVRIVDPHSDSERYTATVKRGDWPLRRS